METADDEGKGLRLKALFKIKNIRRLSEMGSLLLYMCGILVC